MPKKKQSKNNDGDLRTMRFIVTGDRVCRYRGFVLPTGQFVSVPRQKAGIGWNPAKSQQARVYEPEHVYASEQLAQEAAGMVEGFYVEGDKVVSCMMRPEGDGTLKVDGRYDSEGFRTRGEAVAALRKELNERLVHLKTSIAAVNQKRKALA